MRNDTISSLALKKMCYILLRTCTDWWLNIMRHIKLAPSPQHLKQEKGKSTEKKGKRGSSQLVKTVEKRNALFFVSWEDPPLLRTLSRHIWYSPTGKQLIVKPYNCLPQRQTGHAYATFARQTCLGLYTWGWITLSYKDSNYVQMVCLGRIVLPCMWNCFYNLMQKHMM